MNRILHLVDEPWNLPLESSIATDPFTPEPSDEADASHCIFTPLHYERNYAYPLIVWLHGPNDDERQVSRVMPLVSLRNFVAVGPRGTLRGPRSAPGYCWSQAEHQIAMAEQGVFSAIATARRWLNIAPRRIYLAGLGCGGTMALRLALNQPDRFAGVLSIQGPFPETLRPLGQLQAARRLQIFLATGRESQEYPEARVCSHLRLLHTAGMAVNLRQYPCGDDLTTNMLSDMDRWIMEQIAAPQTCEQNAPSPGLGGH